MSRAPPPNMIPPPLMWNNFLFSDTLLDELPSSLFFLNSSLFSPKYQFSTGGPARNTSFVLNRGYTSFPPPSPPAFKICPRSSDNYEERSLLHLPFPPFFLEFKMPLKFPHPLLRKQTPSWEKIPRFISCTSHSFFRCSLPIATFFFVFPFSLLFFPRVAL